MRTDRTIKESALGTVPEAAMAKKLSVLAWHPLKLVNGWTSYGHGYAPASYAIDAQDVDRSAEFGPDGVSYSTSDVDIH